MNKKHIIILCLALLAGRSGIAQSIRTSNGFQIRTGVNTGLWLSQTEKRGEARAKFMTESDFKNISSMGFDHIRLPIDEVQMWDEEGNKEEEAFLLMHKAIQWSLEREMRIIIDLHIIRSHFFDSKTNTLWDDPKEQEKLLFLWNQLSDELNKYPNDWLAYELLNEAVADDHEKWNDLIKKLHSAIRQAEPERTIVIGSNLHQGSEAFPFLKVPENDPNIILSFHYYRPFGLTHFNTPWTSLKKYSGPVHYPGQVLTRKEQNSIPEEIKYEILWAMGNWDKQRIFEDIVPVIELSEKTKLPIYCGEFGVYFKAPKEDALRWYSDMTDLFRENNIAFSHWEYKSEFLIVDKEGNPLHPLVDYLTK